MVRIFTTGTYDSFEGKVRRIYRLRSRQQSMPKCNLEPLDCEYPYNFETLLLKDLF